MPGFFTLFDGKMRAPGEDLLSVVVHLMKLLCLPVIGLILAHPKTQIALRATFKLLSKLVFALFLPCLIFTHLGQSITLKNVALWWFIPVNVVVSTVIGCILGYVVAIICCPPPEFIRFTIIMTAFGNTGYLSIGIVGSVCHSSNHSFGPDCHRTSVACVPLAQWVAVILVYTLVYYMMEPPLEYYEIVEEEIEIVEREQVNEVSRPLLVEAEWPGIEDKETEHSKTPFIARVFKSISGLSHTAFPELDLTEEGSCSSPKSIRCLACPQE